MKSAPKTRVSANRIKFLVDTANVPEATRARFLWELETELLKNSVGGLVERDDLIFRLSIINRQGGADSMGLSILTGILSDHTKLPSVA